MLILSGRTPGREIDEGTWIKMRVNMIKSNVLSLPGLTLSQKTYFYPMKVIRRLRVDLICNDIIVIKYNVFFFIGNTLR